ncbi:VanZ family protein [Tamlana sp. 2201CG12-4]|uniref:VanZ family protein n=1 Tax=Tamlana sp. 2201CG12-4 TaxID=3112582 RepID=UPI002DB6A200|nr:VanZ family protein [Tamlana sp. 2201CG12-4]MEC3905803.1 VanZ family protein [Tamlana sp. 2201CG12-4]
MLKKAALLAAISYSLILAIVSLIKLNNLPDVGISFADKIFHFLAYALLTLLWFGAFSYSLNLKKKQAVLYAAILAIIFGIIIEVLQDTMTDSRALDMYDVVANTLGALLASIVLKVKNKLQVKND